MSTAWVCQIDAATRGGAARTIRVASHDDERLCHLDEQLWWPAIERLPTLSYDFFDGAFGGEIVTPTGQAELSLDAIPGLAPLMLHGARIRWWSGELGDAWDGFVLRFDGLIESQPAVRGGKVGIDFRVDDRWLDDPLLATYAGTTGAEGEAALKGQVKPLLLGAPGMVEGVLANSIDTMIQLNDGPIAGVDVAFEGAARFAEPIDDYASYAALMAAPIAEGQWATALAAGWVRHGAPGDGVLTYDVQGSNAGADGGGQVRRAGAMILRLAARAGKSAKVDAAGLAAIDAARPWNLSRALTEQTTMRQVAQELAQSINAVALVTWTGLLTMLPIPLPEDAAPVGTLASDGSSLPPVASVDQLGIATPWWQLAIEAEVTNRVLGSDEVRFTAMLIDRGRYDPAESYREGHIVDLADGSRWLYTSMTPTSGNAPAEGSAYWTMISPPRPIIAPTDISPTPPLELPEGTLWIAPDGHPYRFGTRPWIGADGEAWIAADGEPWLGSGYTDVQDQVGVTAKNIADAVTAQVARIADDGWLTAGEKSGLVHSHKALIENYVALNAKAIAIGEAATERANATAAVNALNAYLVSLSPAWNDTTQDTAADADTITSLWGDAAQKVALLQAAIQGLPGPAGADGAPGTPGAPGTDGVDGIDGEDGKLIEFVWKRAPTEPTVPTGNGIPSGWSDDPPEGTDPLWMSKAKQELDGTLVAGEAWSDPIRHDGPPGADGAAGFSVSPPAKSYIIACSANGTPKSGELPKTISFTVLQGSADLSDDAGTTYSVVNVDCTAAMGGTNGKVWTCTAIGADTAKSTVTVIRNGDTIAIVEIELAKARDGYGAIALHDNTLTINNSGSYTGSQGGPITMTVGPGGTIKANAFINYSTTGSLTKLAGKIQYRTTPGSGSWVDLTSEVQDPFGAQINEPSALSVSGSVAGPNPAANWEFQFVNRRYSGSSTLNVDAGDFSTEWSGS